VFGERAARAAEAAARRLDLDYGGMDCALLSDGRLLLFEANACMRVYLEEPEEAFPCSRRYGPAIREAFSAMVRERISAGRRGLTQSPKPARSRGDPTRLTRTERREHK
jgi:hypothetical protein